MSMEPLQVWLYYNDFFHVEREREFCVHGVLHIERIERVDYLCACMELLGMASLCYLPLYIPMLRERDSTLSIFFHASITYDYCVAKLGGEKYQ